MCQCSRGGRAGDGVPVPREDGNRERGLPVPREERAGQRGLPVFLGNESWGRGLPAALLLREDDSEGPGVPGKGESGSGVPVLSPLSAAGDGVVAAAAGSSIQSTRSWLPAPWSPTASSPPPG